MFATSKVLSSNVKPFVSKLVFSGFSQSKNGPLNNLGALSGLLGSENPKTPANNMIQNISFGITHAKHVSEISHDIPVNAELKRIQKTAAMVHCFNPSSHH
jgi:hypothetical protein